MEDFAVCLPEGFQLWHCSNIMSEQDSREMAESIKWMNNDTQRRRFYWILITDAFIPVTECVWTHDNYSRMQYNRPHDYVGIAEVITKRELRLFNMINPGDKEFWFEAVVGDGSRITNKSDQEDVIVFLASLGYDGWISSQDHSDLKNRSMFIFAICSNQGNGRWANYLWTLMR
jgi:hypothetical protein